VNRQLFVNLPVADVAATVAFWKGLGFRFNDGYAEGNTACMVLSPLACVMFLHEPFFHGFHGTVQSLGTELTMSIQAATREEVDQLLTLAVLSGAEESGKAMECEGMYARSFIDPDGHIWEVLWMAGV
jgi:predicted lactoylglutathione lyase